jgi:hypothetical protein
MKTTTSPPPPTPPESSYKQKFLSTQKQLATLLSQYAESVKNMRVQYAVDKEALVK